MIKSIDWQRMVYVSKDESIDGIADKFATRADLFDAWIFKRSMNE